MNDDRIQQGELVDANDVNVGYYYHIYANRYAVSLYGYRQEMTKNQMLEKLEIMNINMIPDLN